MDIKLLATQIELFHAIFDKSCDAIVVVDTDFNVRYWSESAERLFGYSAASIVGKDLNEHVTPDRFRQGVYDSFADYQAHGTGNLLGRIHEVQLCQSDGTEFWADLSLTDIRVEGQKWLLAIIRDAESRKERELKLQHAASTDSLSGIPNRSEFQSRLEENLGEEISLAIIDVDQFKLINDEHGHPVGDEAIQHVSAILKEMFDDAICFARLGGDEFGVILGVTQETLVKERFQKLLQRLVQSEFSDSALQITASVGVAISSEESTARSLLTNADKALYQSKQGGRNRVTVVADSTVD